MPRVLALIFGVRLVAVVDRIEGDTAVLEWSAGVFADSPLDLLPQDTVEGDRLVAWLRPTASGPLAMHGPAIITPQGVLELPLQVPIRPGNRYSILIKTTGFIGQKNRK